MESNTIMNLNGININKTEQRRQRVGTVIVTVLTALLVFALFAILPSKNAFGAVRSVRFEGSGDIPEGVLFTFLS